MGDSASLCAFTKKNHYRLTKQQTIYITIFIMHVSVPPSARGEYTVLSRGCAGYHIIACLKGHF